MKPVIMITGIAAVLPIGKKVLKNQEPSPSDNSQTPKRKKIMTFDEFKANHPDLYAQAKEEGRLAESKRVSGHATMAKKTGAYDFAFDCIKDKSKSIMDDDVFAEYQVAGMKKEDLKDRQDDNPPPAAVEPGTEKTEKEKVEDLKNKIVSRIKGDK